MIPNPVQTDPPPPPPQAMLQQQQALQQQHLQRQQQQHLQQQHMMVSTFQRPVGALKYSVSMLVHKRGVPCPKALKLPTK